MTTTVDVVVARAVIERDGRILLVRRSAWDSMPGCWELPGGKVDPDEPLTNALAREVCEETGLELARPGSYSTYRLVSPSGRQVEERVYDVPACGEVTLSNEHDAHVWTDDPSAFPLTGASEFALASRDRLRPPMAA